MTRDRMLQAAGPGSVGTIKNWLHAVAAGAFFFLLQGYGMNASLDTSPVWALALGACAAGLAYMQSNR